MGRARAWLRLALMQKKLADYFRLLVDQGDDVLSEFYEPRALLRSDEAALVTGLLLGLNIVDCNLCVKVQFLIQVLKLSNSLQNSALGRRLGQSTWCD